MDSHSEGNWAVGRDLKIIEWEKLDSMSSKHQGRKTFLERNHTHLKQERGGLEKNEVTDPVEIELSDQPGSGLKGTW